MIYTECAFPNLMPNGVMLPSRVSHQPKWNTMSLDLEGLPSAPPRSLAATMGAIIHVAHCFVYPDNPGDVHTIGGNKLLSCVQSLSSSNPAVEKQIRNQEESMISKPNGWIEECHNRESGLSLMAEHYCGLKYRPRQKKYHIGCFTLAGRVVIRKKISIYVWKANHV